MIEKFEQEDFPARKAQPYYYDDNGNLKKKWSKKIIGVGRKSQHGPHNQYGFFLKLDDNPGPHQVVYAGEDGRIPKPGDDLEFVLNESVSKEVDYPAYSVILSKKLTVLEKILSKLGILK